MSRDIVLGRAGVFINYRNVSAAWAVLLDEALSARFGTSRVFRASRSIRPGDDFRERIAEGVRRSSVLLAVIGSGWPDAIIAATGGRDEDTRDWVRWEIAEAFRLEARVVPVLVDDVPVPRRSALPPDIAKISDCQYLRLHYRSARWDLDRVCAELAALCPELAQPIPEPPDPGSTGTHRLTSPPRYPSAPPEGLSFPNPSDGQGPPRTILNDEVAALMVALREGVPWPWESAGGPGSFCDLPADVDWFTGRAEELTGLSRELSRRRARDHTVTVALYGKPGVGKSMLAVRAAHRVRRESDADGLYLDLKGTGGSPISPARAIGKLLHALGYSMMDLPVDLDDRVRLYRRILSNRRPVVVLLDDAASADQVRPLLPTSPGSRALVTSRRPLAALPAARTIPVDVMSPEDAKRLFRSLAFAGRQPVATQRPNGSGAVGDVVELVGRLPLAIGIAATLLARRPAWSVEDLRRELSAERERLSRLRVDDVDVRSAFRLSYLQLEATERLALMRLGALNMRTFQPSIVKALLDSSLDVARRAVVGLADAQLIDAISGTRYGFHELIRLFAQELSHDEDSGDRAAAVERAVRSYARAAHQHADRIDQLGRSRPVDDERSVLGTAGSALARFEERTSPAVAPDEAARRWHAGSAPGGDALLDRELGLLTDLEAQGWFAADAAWFDTERENLLQAQHLAAENGLHDVVCALSAGMSPSLALRGEHIDAAAVQQRALRSAEMLSDQVLISWTLIDLANSLHRSGRPDAAVSLLRHAQELRSGGDEPDGVEDRTVALAKINLRLGHVAREGNQLSEAERRYTAAARYYDEAHRPGGVAGALSNLALLHKVRGDTERAKATTLAAFELAFAPRRSPRGLVVVRDHAWYVENLGSILKGDGRHTEAARLHRYSLAVFASVGDVGAAACALRNLGDCALAAGEAETAEQLYSVTLAVYERLGHHRGRAQALISLGLLYSRRRRFPRATRYLAAGALASLRLGDRVSLRLLRTHLRGGRRGGSPARPAVDRPG